jgi:hypothetical protein
MSLPHPPLRAALVALLAAITLVSATATAGAKTAPSRHAVRIVLSRHGLRSGSVRVTAVVRGRARRVVFRIDGRHGWTARRRPYRYRRTGVIREATFGRGTHVVTVRAVLARHRVATARVTFVVGGVVARRTSVSTGTGTAPKSAGGRSATGTTGTPTQGFLNTPTTAPSGAPVALFNRETFAYSSSLSISQEANRYQVLVLQDTNRSLVPALRAANPNLKILLYQDLELGRPSDAGGLTVCSNWGEVTANHPDWLVRDQNGQPVEDRGYPGNYLMDVGNAAYEQSCAAHAVALARQGGFDGVYFDDVGASISWVPRAGVQTPAYPTAQSWQTAMTSMLQAVVPQVHSQGLLAFGNIGAAAAFPGVWSNWSSILDGSEEQSWNDWRDLTQAELLRAWPALLQEAAWSEAHGKYAILQSYDSGASQNQFGLASMLLVAGGKTSYATSTTNLTSAEDWYPAYSAAIELGAPAGAYQLLSNGVYERVFAHGVVLVNPTSATARSISFGRLYYTGSSNTPVTGMTMSPASATILTTNPS